MQWRGGPPKNTLPHICHHAEFSRSRSNCVRISRGEPAKLRSARTKPQWDWGRGWPPEISPSPYVWSRPILLFFFKEYSHRKRKIPEICERWNSAPFGRGRDWPLKTNPLPISDTTSNSVVLRQWVYAEIEGNPRNGERRGPSPALEASLTP